MRATKWLVSIGLAAAVATFAACGDGASDDDAASPSPEVNTTAGTLAPTAGPTPVTVPVDAFVQALCEPWNEFYVRYLELQAGFVASTSNAEHKQKLIEMTSLMEEASQGLIAAIPALPAPEGESGVEARQVFVDFFIQEQTTLARYVEDLEELNPDSDEEFQAQLQALIDSAPPNNIEANLTSMPPLGPLLVTLIDQEPNDCGLIFIAF